MYDCMSALGVGLSADGYEGGGMYELIGSSVGSVDDGAE